MTATAKDLYAEMDRTTPAWRNAGYANFDAAVLAAGPAAVEMCASWKKAFAKKTDVRLAAKDARNVEIDRLAQEKHKQRDAESYRPPMKEVDTPAFEQSATGRYLAAEWRERFVREYQPGLPKSYAWLGPQAALADDYDDDSQRAAVSIGRQHDSLFHPDRPANAAPWSFPSYVWNPVAPRSYSDAIPESAGNADDILEFQARARATHAHKSSKSY